MPPIVYELEVVGFVGSEMTARNPKSARRAWRDSSIKMFALIEDRVRTRGSDRRSKSYPLQIPMYHPLIVHVDQPPGNIFELSERIVNGGCGQR